MKKKILNVHQNKAVEFTICVYKWINDVQKFVDFRAYLVWQIAYINKDNHPKVPQYIYISLFRLSALTLTSYKKFHWKLKETGIRAIALVCMQSPNWSDTARLLCPLSLPHTLCTPENQTLLSCTSCSPAYRVFSHLHWMPGRVTLIHPGFLLFT